MNYEGSDLEALADLPRYHAWILETLGPYLRGRVLEVGAGTGNFAARWIDGAAEAVLLEPAPNLHATLAARFEGRRAVRVMRGFVEELAGTEPLSPGTFDAAVLVNVLEHVPDDGRMLSILRDLLRPGGRLLLFVPALPVLHGTLDELVHHVRRYTRDELAGRIAAADLRVETLRYFDVLGIVPWLVAGRVLRQRTFSARAAALYDRAGVPLTRALERRVEPPLGKNLICVAVRAE